MTDPRSIDDRASSDDIALSFSFPNEIVTVTVTGYTKGITALKAVGEAGLAETVAKMSESLAVRGQAATEPVILEFSYADDDQATVTVTGHTSIERALDALSQAGAEPTFRLLYSVFVARGDTSLGEI